MNKCRGIISDTLPSSYTPAKELDNDISIIVTDISGKALYANPSFCKSADRSYDEIIGRNAESLIFGTMPEEEYKAVWAEVLKGNEWRGAISNASRNGKETIEKLSLLPIKDRDDNIVQAIAIKENITDFVYENKKICEGIKRCRLLTDNSYQFMGLLTMDGILLEVNRAALQFVDIAAEDIIGKPFWECPWWIHSDILQEKLKESIKKAAEGEFVRFEATHLDNTHQVHYIDFSLKPVLNEDGQVIFLIPEGRDVTDRKMIEESAKENEEKFRIITDSTMHAIIIMDEECIINFWNKSAQRLFGYAEDEILGKNLNEVLFPSERDISIPTLLQELKNMPPEENLGKVIEYTTVHNGKTHIPIELSLSPMVLNNIWYAVAIIKDLTELKANQSKLLQAEKLASIGTLASGIAHEINTPIQFIGDNVLFLSDAFQKVMEFFGSVDELVSNEEQSNKHICNDDIKNIYKMLDIDFLIKEIPPAIDQTMQGIERVATIIRAMKEFSHPDQREKTLTDVNNAINTTLTVARNEIKYVADVVTVLDEDLPLVQCFPSEMNQVFLNLLVNAAHAISATVDENDNEKGTITIKTYKENDQVVISIGDTGTGIRPEIADQVFDPFFTTKEVGKGTGQGLAIARSVVSDKHNGSLTFESSEGKGTTFYIRLPLATKEEYFV